jgi:hypothetical protein
MHPPIAGFELAVPAGERPQTHGLDRAATGIGWPNDIKAVKSRRLE